MPFSEFEMVSLMAAQLRNRKARLPDRVVLLLRRVRLRVIAGMEDNPYYAELADQPERRRA